MAGPLAAYAARSAAGAQVRARGYGPLADRRALALPRGFRYRVISRAGREMTDGNPTPTAFDGMAAFRGPGRTTVLIRNHENRSGPGAAPNDAEIAVVVPAALRYDPDPGLVGGVTKVVVSPGLRAREERALLGGTTTNCAGGRTPWGSWITCEESFSDGARPHGYVFEVQASADGPVRALPIRGAGRFVHEAVAWHGAALYETEDRGDASARAQAQAAGAAIFSRQEGAWAVGARRVYFDCTDGGEAEKGQIWELDPRRDRLRLVFESTGQGQLDAPDNLTLAPATGDVLVCEDGDGTQFVRGLTAAGRIYDLARSSANDTEFCGACFSPDGRVLFVNQQGAGRAIPAVTYAIWGPWARRVR